VAYSYDANGNYLNGGAGSASWNADNQPTSLTNNGLSEQFTYDADGERLSRTHGGLTTYYIGDWLEYDVQGGAIVASRYLFRFNGQVVATNAPRNGCSTT
jgi:YD repeat-containing protein